MCLQNIFFMRNVLFFKNDMTFISHRLLLFLFFSLVSVVSFLQWLYHCIITADICRLLSWSIIWITAGARSPESSQCMLTRWCLWQWDIKSTGRIRNMWNLVNCSLDDLRTVTKVRLGLSFSRKLFIHSLYAELLSCGPCKSNDKILNHIVNVIKKVQPFITSWSLLNPLSAYICWFRANTNVKWIIECPKTFGI